MTVTSNASGEGVPERLIAHGRLDADRESGALGHHLDEVDHRVDIVELGVVVGAHDGLTLGNAACRRDLGGDLGAGEHAAQARLGPLAELDLDGSHRGRLHRGGEHVETEPVGVAASEVGGPHLVHECSSVAMVAADPTFAGVVQHIGNGRASVQGLDGRTAQ